MDKKIIKGMFVVFVFVSAFAYLVMSGELYVWCDRRAGWFGTIFGIDGRTAFIIIGAIGFVVAIVAAIISAVPFVKRMFWRK